MAKSRKVTHKHRRRSGILLHPTSLPGLYGNGDIGLSAYHFIDFVKGENFYENKTDLTRILLQLYGTEIFRDRIDPDYWVKQTIERIKKTEESVSIITDVRFPNEIEMLDNDVELNTIVIRVERNIKRDGDKHEHESETALDNYVHYDYIVDNNGSLEDLWNSASTIKDELFKKEIK